MCSPMNTTCEFCFHRVAHDHTPDPYTTALCDSSNAYGITAGAEALGIRRIDYLASMWASTITPRPGQRLFDTFASAPIRRIIGAFLWPTLIIPHNEITEWTQLKLKRETQRRVLRFERCNSPIPATPPTPQDPTHTIPVGTLQPFDLPPRSRRPGACRHEIGGAWGHA